MNARIRALRAALTGIISIAESPALGTPRDDIALHARAALRNDAAASPEVGVPTVYGTVRPGRWIDRVVLLAPDHEVTVGYLPRGLSDLVADLAGRAVQRLAADLGLIEVARCGLGGLPAGVAARVVGAAQANHTGTDRMFDAALARAMVNYQAGQRGPVPDLVIVDDPFIERDPQAPRLDITVDVGETPPLCPREADLGSPCLGIACMNECSSADRLNVIATRARHVVREDAAIQHPRPADPLAPVPGNLWQAWTVDTLARIRPIGRQVRLHLPDRDQIVEGTLVGIDPMSPTEATGMRILSILDGDPDDAPHTFTLPLDHPVEVLR